MRITLLFIHRILLTVGVLIALTPCSICHPSGMAQKAMSHCSMSHKGGHDCCHAKKASPFCQIMDQSSVSAASVHLNGAAVQTVPMMISVLPVSKTVMASSVVPSFGSPPRGPLALRI